MLGPSSSWITPPSDPTPFPDGPLQPTTNENVKKLLARPIRDNPQIGPRNASP